MNEIKLKKLKEPNYRKMFIEMADFAYSQISVGNTDIEGALDMLRGILEAKNKNAGIIKFEKK